MKALTTAHVFILVTGMLALCGAALLPGTMMTGYAAVAEKTERKERPLNSSKDQRLYMLNVLWFKQEGGAEKYQEYLRAATPLVAKHGGKSDGAYVPEANIIGNFDADLVFFVEWPNQKAFVEFIQDPGYQAISHLRTEAIRDSFLVRCKRK